MSTSATNAPSRYTRAMPPRRRRSPIHRIDVPEKVNTARAPAACDHLANSPLQKLNRPPSVHAPEYTMPAAVS